MDVRSINALLAQGKIEQDELWPHLKEMRAKPLQFRFEFGLDVLPQSPGLITIRGPRQYGKSTWLEIHLYDTIQKFGKGSALYLNGDEIPVADDLLKLLEEFHNLFSPQAPLKRLFIDEITAIPQWERAIKRAIDSGLYRDVLIITTGSKALDLRRGSERLPGRKGKLSQSEYIFLPISYKSFYEKAAGQLGEKTWIAYLLSGGSPLACNDLYQLETLPEYFIQLIHDWIFGEIISSGRSRQALLNLFQVLFRYGGNPVGYAKLAREAGLANNTIAGGYVEQLSDLLCVLPAWPIDTNSKTLQLRKPCKFHFINMAAVVCVWPGRLRSISDFQNLSETEQGMLLEWFVAQELWRRSILKQSPNPEWFGFWQSQEHEIDFVTFQQEFIEVKRGSASPVEFSWFPKVFPKKHLSVICTTPFESAQVTGITLHDFLMGK